MINFTYLFLSIIYTLILTIIILIYISIFNRFINNNFIILWKKNNFMQNKYSGLYGNHKYIISLILLILITLIIFLYQIQINMLKEQSTLINLINKYL
jgi:hypothetical protein